MNNVYKMKLSYFLLIIVGTAGVAFAVQCMYDPCGLVTGGFSGIAIIIKSLTEHIIPGGVPLWLTNLLLNIPVFIVAYIKMGKRFIGRTLFGTVMLSVWLYILPVVDLTQGDMLLVAEQFYKRQK